MCGGKSGKSKSKKLKSNSIDSRDYGSPDVEENLENWKGELSRQESKQQSKQESRQQSRQESKHDSKQESKLQSHESNDGPDGVSKREFAEIAKAAFLNKFEFATMGEMERFITKRSGLSIDDERRRIILKVMGDTFYRGCVAIRTTSKTEN